MKKTKIFVILIIAFLSLGFMVTKVYAWFLGYRGISEEIPISLNSCEVELSKSIENDKIIINPENTGNTACFLRVKIVLPSSAKIEILSNDWILKDDGYLYYSNIVEPKETLNLEVKVNNLNSNQINNFNILVVDEATTNYYYQGEEIICNWE